jgi:molybdate transport system substrate-binding protein
VISVRSVARAAIAGMVVVSVLACAPTDSRSPESSRIVVAAAADLRFALDDVISATVESHPNLRFQVTYGSSGQFLQQIQAGAPFDLFLSADIGYPRALVTAGAASADDLFTYAFGQVVLWLPEGSPLSVQDGIDVLTDQRIRTVSIANPQHAPYGRAALDALTTAGILPDVEDKLIMGENVAQAAEFVASGNADAGIVAMSLVVSTPLNGIGRWTPIPRDYVAPLEQGGLMLTDSQGARVLRDVLLSDAGQAILARYGFLV